jgi:ketol-acid reductoisomerase
MKRYYVVLEVHHEADQLNATEMASWVASAVGLASTGRINATVYESAADLYSERCTEIIVLEED